MDRRTVLAFLLMFLVFTGYQILVGRDAEKRRQGLEQIPPATTEFAADQASDRDLETRPVGRPVVAPAPATAEAWGRPLTIEAAMEPLDRDQLEATVTVETSAYVVEVAGRGARITSWLGRHYTDARQQPVQIIPQGEQAIPYGHDAVVFDSAEFDLGRHVFTTDSPSRVQLTRGTHRVVFRLRTVGDLEIRKIYTFDADSYEITLDLELAAVGAQATTARTLLGVPRQARFGWIQGIASTEGKDRLEEASFRSFAGVGDNLELKRRGAQIKNAERVHGVYSGRFRFAGIQNKYFTIFGLPAHDLATPPTATVVLSGDPQRNVQTWSIEFPMQPESSGVDAMASSRLVLYLGPQEGKRLKSYGVGLEKTMDLGWALVRPLTEATLWIMAQMRRVIPNYGVIIILFSVLTKVAFYPLTRTSTQSMKRMQQLQPKIKELQEKHKDNREKLSQETMKLYKREKINPMAGCLPLLLQMPVFIALYQALAHTIALRNTPFFGWINDLSKPDALFTLPFSLPLLGPDFNVLPLLMTATMVVQMRMTPTGQAPAQMAMMNTLMPVIFLFFFYQMPSGLVLYWLVNNVVTIYQTWRIHKTATPEGGSRTS